MIGRIDLRVVRAHLRSCPVCRSWEIMVFNVEKPKTGAMDGSIICMDCGFRIESEDIRDAAHQWGVKEACA